MASMSTERTQARPDVLEMFMTPVRVKESKLERSFLATALHRPRDIQGTSIATYQWGTGPTVLLVHGWGGKVLQFHHVVPRLVERGYAVFAFDAPAHGRSAGAQSSLIQFASIVGELLGDPELRIQCVVGHSMGAGSVAVAVARAAFHVRRAVLISPICRLRDVVTRFSRRVRLTSEEEAELASALQELFGAEVWGQRGSLAELAHRIEIPMLVVHDRDDPEVPFQHGIELAAALPRSEVVATQGLGHRTILYDAAVVRRVVQFVEEA